jgi:hypothetical protein
MYHHDIVLLFTTSLQHESESHSLLGLFIVWFEKENQTELNRTQKTVCLNRTELLVLHPKLKRTVLRFGSLGCYASEWNRFSN